MTNFITGIKSCTKKAVIVTNCSEAWPIDCNRDGSKCCKNLSDCSNDMAICMMTAIKDPFEDPLTPVK